MKKIFVFSCLLLCNTIFAQTIHVLLVSDTNAYGIGPSVAQNHKMLKQRFEKIKIQTGLEVKIHELLGNQVRPNEIVKKINALTTKDKDILWFHYSGHGVNNGVNEWPRFMLPGENTISLDEVHRMLKKKPHQLLLSIADCCNIGSDMSVKGAQPEVISARTTERTEMLKNLFVKSEGDIIVSGSKPGNPARYFQSSGGIFTVSLMDILEKCGNNGCYSWDYVLEETRKATLETSRIFGIEQNIQIEIEDETTNNGTAIDNAETTKIVGNYEPYIVKRADTCFGIAQKFLLDRNLVKKTDKDFVNIVIRFMNVITADNNILDPTSINPGDNLKIRRDYKPD